METEQVEHTDVDADDSVRARVEGAEPAGASERANAVRSQKRRTESPVVSNDTGRSSAFHRSSRARCPARSSDAANVNRTSPQVPAGPP